MATFNESLAYGQVGESLIARWLRKREYWVLPVYEKEIDTGKGPRLFLPVGQLIAPDLIALKPATGAAFWIEAKHKSAFTWHRLTEQWVTGIDLRHYADYLRICDQSPWPIWLLFLQRAGQAKDSPAGCPTGLYGGDLAFLRQHEHHRHDNWGRGGMVYWAEGDLKKLAHLRDLIPT